MWEVCNDYSAATICISSHLTFLLNTVVEFETFAGVVCLHVCV